MRNVRRDPHKGPLGRGVADGIYWVVYLLVIVFENIDASLYGTIGMAYLVYVVELEGEPTLQSIAYSQQLQSPSNDQD